MRKTILILVCVIVLIQGIAEIVRIINPNFPHIVNEYIAFNVGKITGILFKIAIGIAGLIILLRKYNKVPL
jgi:hypothetical protein